MTNLPADRRLFVPLSAEPFEWFSSRGKQWEVRRNNGAFRADRLTCGRRVELRRGYTGDSLWGTLTEAVSASNAAELFAHVHYAVTVPTVASRSDAIAFVEGLLGEDQELVAFRVALDDEPAVQEIRFDPDLLELVDIGTKTTTIRAGHRHYQPGPAVLRFGSDIRRDAAIVRTRLTTLDELTIHDARSDGYATTDELVAVLRRYYPDLADRAPVTVVEFTCRPD
jgi:ASCH domain